MIYAIYIIQTHFIVRAFVRLRDNLHAGKFAIKIKEEKSVRLIYIPTPLMKSIDHCNKKSSITKNTDKDCYRYSFKAENRRSIKHRHAKSKHTLSCCWKINDNQAV